MEFGNPPKELSEEVKAYLLRQFRQLDLQVGKADFFTPSTRLPNDPGLGMVRCFSGAIAGTDITEAGLYFYNGSHWVALNNTGSDHYGVFHDTTTQTIASTTTAYAVGINTTDESNGVSITSGNRITFAYPGTYNIQFSLQLENGDTSIHDVDIWFRKNGSDIAASNSKVSVPNSHGGVHGFVIPAWNFMTTVVANDYIQVMWCSNSTQVQMPTFAAGTSPTRPITPSVILTVEQVR